MFFPSVHTRIKRKSIRERVRRKVICNKFLNENRQLPSAAYDNNTTVKRRTYASYLRAFRWPPPALFITQTTMIIIYSVRACCTIVSGRKNKPLHPEWPLESILLLLLLLFSLFARLHRAVVLTYGPCVESVSFCFVYHETHGFQRDAQHDRSSSNVG